MVGVASALVMTTPKTSLMVCASSYARCGEGSRTVMLMRAVPKGLVAEIWLGSGRAFRPLRRATASNTLEEFTRSAYEATLACTKLLACTSSLTEPVAALDTSNCVLELYIGVAWKRKSDARQPPRAGPATSQRHRPCRTRMYSL